MILLGDGGNLNLRPIRNGFYIARFFLLLLLPRLILYFFFVSLFAFKKYTQTIEKGEYSFDGKKGFFTARLQIGPLPGDSISCNFILSVEGSDTEDPVWLIDSILIRPQSMRRRRRK
ncbi:MAG: hypothetical protein ACI8RD_013151 [Bacillariaceae sp.]|jgi:hypothetical protein